MGATRTQQTKLPFAEPLLFLAHRYPRLRHLLDLKRDLINASAIPPTYLCADLRDTLGPPPPVKAAQSPGSPFHLATLMPVKYDVVLIDPPLNCYGEARRALQERAELS